jgi:hypothetical protein
MKPRLAFLLFLIWASLPLLGQKAWETRDYAKGRITAADVAGLSDQELRYVRGIIFGRHGRIFGADRDIDAYLRARSWYTPRKEYANNELDDVERENLDVIRMAEATRHEHIQPGDLRIWQKQKMTEAKLGEHTAAELRVLLAEVEAIHGKTFPDSPMLQRYFEARYWYEPKPDYDPKTLTTVERGNIGVIETAMRHQRKRVLLPGELGPYIGKAIPAELLNGLGLYELRLLRNEVYARRGYSFAKGWLAGYFYRHDWYATKEKVELTPADMENVKLIVARERALHDALSTKKIDPASLEGLFDEDLRRLRNEIFARHGRTFKDPDLRDYFGSFDWYKPDPTFTEASLSPLERANVDTIRRIEDTADSRFIFEG